MLNAIENLQIITSKVFVHVAGCKRWWLIQGPNYNNICWENDGLPKIGHLHEVEVGNHK